MTSARATRRRRAAARRTDRIPMIPGLVPDLSDESRHSAMMQAHQDLPPVSRSTVQLRFLTPTDGLELISDHFGPDAADTIAAKLAELDGTDPHIVIAARIPRHLKKVLT